MSKEEINIRPAEAADATRIAELRASIRLSSPRELMGSVIEEIAQMRHDIRHLAVAEFQGDVVAFARAMSFNRTNRPDERPSGWYLSGVVVRESMRRRGIGRRLVEARLEWLRGRTNLVRAVAATGNEASVALLTDAGFRKVGFVDDDTRDFFLFQRTIAERPGR